MLLSISKMSLPCIPGSLFLHYRSWHFLSRPIVPHIICQSHCSHHQSYVITVFLLLKIIDSLLSTEKNVKVLNMVFKAFVPLPIILSVFQTITTSFNSPKAFCISHLHYGPIVGCYVSDLPLKGKALMLGMSYSPKFL